ncbi:hypothetical protein OG705_29070 [Streptomyces sp. NBC_00838]|uniref:hypothetical protein n=1 Tax=Streptomyces sp. NBC_00838 TaxID=2903680 RepID=UPI00386FF97F|nr:hypothetical protein OG705_29070 [Streptomyces sp. NBC_00838]
MKTGKTLPLSWADALESARLLQSPETAAELEELRESLAEAKRANSELKSQLTGAERAYAADAKSLKEQWDRGATLVALALALREEPSDDLAGKLEDLGELALTGEPDEVVTLVGEISELASMDEMAARYSLSEAAEDPHSRADLSVMSPPTPPAEVESVAVEYGIRMPDGDVIDASLDRADTLARLGRYRDSWPGACLMSRPVAHGPWTEVAS